MWKIWKIDIYFCLFYRWINFNGSVLGNSYSEHFSCSYLKRLSRVYLSLKSLFWNYQIYYKWVSSLMLFKKLQCKITHLTTYSIGDLPKMDFCEVIINQLRFYVPSMWVWNTKIKDSRSFKWLPYQFYGQAYWNTFVFFHNFEFVSGFYLSHWFVSRS